MDAYHGTPGFRLAGIWQSFRELPLWLQAWALLILMPLNAAGFLLLDTFSGQITALALVVVLAVNLPLMWLHGGMNKDMSLVHLLAWVPLEAALLGQLAGLWGDDYLTPLQWAFTLTVIMINAINLFFDIVDAWCWAQGDRVTLHPEHN
ncbi:MAG: hypothetical protein MI745_00675 [Pseudomonadales bacterium]|nr:hypothetical protein [Pseudomonadales bacterium]